MELTREEVLHIARLARLGIDDAEVDRLRGQLSDILGNFTVLSKVNTEGVRPPPTPSPSAMCWDTTRLCRPFQRMPCCLTPQIAKATFSASALFSNKRYV